MDTSIDIRHLSKSFNSIKAVDDISFQVQQGEVLGFLGPNGAGKSTTMKMLAGFLTPNSGSIHIAGFDVLENPRAAQAKIGYLPEGAPAYADMSCGQFLKFIAEIRGFQGAERNRVIMQAAERINLLDVLDQPIETLSKGYKRRLGIAQAILHDPAILILDEPTDGLDPNQKHEVRALIQEMSTSKAILLSTHILEEVDAVCDRAIIIAGGRIVADATPQALRAQAPSHNCLSFGLHKQDVPAAKAALESLPHLSKLEILREHADITYFRITPTLGQSLLSEFSAVSRTKNWKIRELHVDSGRLDEYFRAVTKNHQARN